MCRVIAVLAAVAVITSPALGMTWKPCSTDSVFTPSKVLLSPDPPVVGKDVNFDISGEYVADDGKKIEGGTLEVNVLYMGQAIFQTEWDLCSRTECPISPGDISIHYAQNLPPVAPPGQYEVKVVAKGQDDEQLLCMLVDFAITPASWHAGRKMLTAVE